MGHPTSNNLRPIQINFAAYGGSDDDEFKYELIVLMANSVDELKEAALQSMSSRQFEIFRKAAHKAKSTLVLLDDADFEDVVERVKQEMIQSEHNGSYQIESEMTNRFLFFCSSIIKSLEFEARIIKPDFEKF